ncbi:uncharacterized protein BJX67DRAFT_381410 [Aspergillus lucknowensis]|uniref:Uncharacterized protein n=1 Tax=Aspergillus lucknowensis TaxID=176173 RepID=A0ABR4LRD5_9EURO
MAWYSILPAELIYIESWVVRCFVVLGLVTIIPWIALIIFDMILYIWRLVAYNIPWVGGRARGMQRPRAPSLNELPDRFGLGVSNENEKYGGVGTGVGADTSSGGGGELKQRHERASM